MSEAEAGRGEAAAGPEPVVDPVRALEERLETTFADRALALAALTHKSYVNEHREEALQDNERLEFLGDAVIDLAVSHRLMERFAAACEGDLSKMRAAVVDEQGLSEMAAGVAALEALADEEQRRLTDLGYGEGDSLGTFAQRLALAGRCAEAQALALQRGRDQRLFRPGVDTRRIRACRRGPGVPGARLCHVAGAR